MTNSDYEEANTCIMLHVYDSLASGSRKIMIRTVDTDVVVILIGEFHNMVDDYPNAELWVAFGTGKHFCYYSINTICAHLGREQSRCLPPFHAFTGCDTTSSFFGRTKKTAWAIWNAYPEVNEAFIFMLENSYAQVDTTSPFFLLLERFTVLLYDKTSVLESVNEAWLELFCKKNKSLEYLPPTKVPSYKAALTPHAFTLLSLLGCPTSTCEASSFQSSIWTTNHQCLQNVPSPEGWGWTKDKDHGWVPVWMTIPEAARACSEGKRRRVCVCS